MIDRIASSIVLLHGWRALGLAFLAGAASTLALAPLHVWPIPFLTFPIFVLLLDGALPPPRQGVRTPGIIRKLWPAFCVGWMFGFGYFLAGLWWIGNAFLVEAEDFAWLLPIAVTALPAGLALFWGLAGAAARWAWSQQVGRNSSRIIALAAALAGAEWLRGTLFTGFPWNLVGYAAMPNPLTMQTSALIGTYGVTLLALLAFCAPVLLTQKGGARIALPLLLVLVGGHLGFGAWRLNTAESGVQSDVTLRIVQPAIDQREKWIGTNEDAIMARYLDGSNTNTGPATASAAAFSHIIWPESAFPFVLTQRRDRLAQIAGILPSSTTLLTGGMRLEPSADGAPSRIYNSILAIDGSGSLIGARDKTHLVPFGEYLPFAHLLEPLGLEQLANGGGFSAGSRRQSLAFPGTPALLPLICYEIIFPGHVLPAGQERPAWLVNLTNDAWFGNTPGPYQHAHQAQVRAVETGLPLVRAANNGISMITDGYGRITASLPLGVRGVVDGVLSKPTPETAFTRLGNSLAITFIFTLFMLSKILSVTSRRA